MSGTVADALVAGLAERAETIVALAARLVREPSSLPDTEAGVVRILQEEIAALGLPAGEIVAREPSRPNLMIRLTGRRPGRRLILNGHTDTKPAGDPTRWSRDPWAATVEEGRLQGLGAADMNGALAAMLHAGAAIVEAGLPDAGELVLLFSADEEGAGSAGLAHVLGSGALGPGTNRDGALETAALIGEPAGVESSFDTIPVVSRGFYGFTLRARGRTLHSSLSDRVPGANAVEQLAAVIADLRQTLTFEGATVNVATAIEGGIAPGVLPDSAVCRGDVRTPSGLDGAAVTAAIDKRLAELRAADPSFRVELVPDPEEWPASVIPNDHRLVRALRDATGRVLGAAPPAGIFPGASEAFIFERHGIHCIPAFGPGLLANAHAPDEWVAVPDLIRAAQVYALTAAAYLG